MRVSRGFEGKKMTADEQRGIDWWNGLTVHDRGFWLHAASTYIPAEAWAHFKRFGGIAYVQST